MAPFSQSSSSLSRIPKTQSQDLQDFFKEAGKGRLMGDWREGVFDLRDELKTYLLTEIRLYKGQSRVEHEMLLAELRSASGETIYVSTERAAWQPESNEHRKLLKTLSRPKSFRRRTDPKNHFPAQPTKSADDPNEARDANEDTGEDDDDDVVEGKGDGKGDGKDDDDGHNDPSDRKPPLPSTSLSVSSSSGFFSTPVIDYWRKLEGTNFDEAIKHYEKKRLSRKSFVLRGSLEFGPNTDPEFPSTSSPSDNPPAQIPNFMHLTCAALSTHRTAQVYTPQGTNCFWYANAVICILSQSFPHSRLNRGKEAGTLTVAGVTVHLGALEDADRATLMTKYGQCVCILLFFSCSKHVLTFLCPSGVI
jgi:hypothetical protein